MSPSTSQRDCPSCQRPATGPRERVPGKQDVLGAPLELVRCGACGLVFQPITPSDEALARWYEYMGKNPANSTLTPLLGRRLRRLLHRLTPYRGGGRLLEVGCGGGVLLQVAREEGWEISGAEISDSCCQILRPLLGANLHQGTLLDAPFPEGRFDAVLMVEVIEHLRDPAPYLRACLRLLRPGGALLLTTPNFRGLSGRVLGTRWRAVGDEHLSYFDGATISGLLGAVGFQLVQIEYTGVDGAPVIDRLRALKQRLRGPTSKSPPAAPPDRANASSAPSPAAARPIDLKDQLVDEALELLNRGLTRSRLGDSLKVLAIRPGGEES